MWDAWAKHFAIEDKLAAIQEDENIGLAKLIPEPTPEQLKAAELGLVHPSYIVDPSMQFGTIMVVPWDKELVVKEGNNLPYVLEDIGSPADLGMEDVKDILRRQIDKYLKESKYEEALAELAKNPVGSFMFIDEEGNPVAINDLPQPMRDLLRIETELEVDFTAIDQKEKQDE